MVESHDDEPNVPLPRRSPRPGESQIGQAGTRVYGEQAAARRGGGDPRWSGIDDRERSAALARSAVGRPSAPRVVPAGPVVVDDDLVPGEVGDEARPVAPREVPSRSRRSLVALAVVLGIGVILGLLVGRLSGPPVVVAPVPAPLPAWPTVLGQVVAVRDGETVSVRLADRTVEVAILGLDTPTPAGPGIPPECGAGSATRYATDTLAGQQVTLVPDPTIPEVDTAGRRLAYVVLRTQASYTDLALLEGIGRRSTARALWYDQVFVEEEARARDAGAGIWGAPCQAARDSDR